MKRISTEKMIKLMQKWELEKRDYIDSDQLDKLLDKYGDDIYYDRDYSRFEVTRKGENI